MKFYDMLAAVGHIVGQYKGGDPFEVIHDKSKVGVTVEGEYTVSAGGEVLLGKIYCTHENGEPVYAVEVYNF